MQTSLLQMKKMTVNGEKMTVQLTLHIHHLVSMPLLHTHSRIHVESFFVCEQAFIFVIFLH